MNTASITSTNNNNHLVNIKNGIASCGHKVATIYKQPFHALNNLVDHLKNDCAICLLPIIIANRKIALLEDCRHVYHSECIDLYLKNNISCCLCISSVIAEYEYNSIFEFIHDELDYCNQPTCYNNNKTKVKKYAIKKFDVLNEIKSLSKNIDFLAKNIQIIFQQLKNDNFLRTIPNADISTINTSIADLCYFITQENDLIQTFRNKILNDKNEIIHKFDRENIYHVARYIQNTINSESRRRETLCQKKHDHRIATILLNIIVILSVVHFIIGLCKSINFLIN
jgi:hypothetical protein